MEISPGMKNAIEWGYCILIAVVLALLIRFYIGTPTIVRQPSMYPTFSDGERLILNRWSRTINSEVRRGDIVTFEAPSRPELSPHEADMRNPVAIYEHGHSNMFSRFGYYVLEINKTSYIKRVIGLPGEEIRIDRRKSLY